MEKADKGWLMTTIGVSGWMFLLVPAQPASPRQNPETHKMVVCVCVCVCACDCDTQIWTSPPQSHSGRAHRYCYVRECTLPLCVLAVACKMRNEALQSIADRYGILWCSYGMLRNHYGKYRFCPSLIEYWILLPSLTENNNPQSSH